MVAEWPPVWKSALSQTGGHSATTLKAAATSILTIFYFK